MTTDRTPADGRARGVRDALARVLRPIARLMIRRGVPLGDVVGLLKAALVDVAESEAAIPGKRVTDSRISLLTGLHRKDVSALRSGGRPVAEPHGTLAATVLGRWLGDPNLTGADRKPIRLWRRAADGEPSFETLVAGISSDLRPRTVLDELMMLGAVEEDPDEPARLILTAQAIAPSGDAAAALAFFAANLGDHAEAATRNLTAEPGGRRFLERAVFYNRMPPGRLDALEAECRARALALLTEMNAQALKAQRAAGEDAGETERFRFGLYFYREAEGDKPGEEGT